MDKLERYEKRKIWNSLKRGKETDLLDIEVRDNINILLGILNFKSCQLYWTINISMWKIFYAYKMKFLSGIIPVSRDKHRGKDSKILLEE